LWCNSNNALLILDLEASNSSVRHLLKVSENLGILDFCKGQDAVNVPALWPWYIASPPVPTDANFYLFFLLSFLELKVREIASRIPIAT
jgi:hypothetical protein